MTTAADVLDKLAPALPWEPEWDDVLARAGRRGQFPSFSRRPPHRRRLILVAAIVLAVLVPLTAIAATHSWWFQSNPRIPSPLKSPVVVMRGVWSGHSWQLVAYPSISTGLCYTVTPTTSARSGANAALACGPVIGSPPSPRQAHLPRMTITFLSASGLNGFPAYIAGPVIDTASTVEIRLDNGRLLRTPTFAAPSPLEHVRFYATVLPTKPSRTHPRGGVPVGPRWLAGLDKNGKIVACLAPATARDGISPVSACR